MAKYSLYFKDTDPDTGTISQTKLIATISSARNSLDWIKEALYNYGDSPNRDFYYYKIDKKNEKIKMDQIELINSEGPILIAQKRGENGFTIIDKHKKSIAVLSKEEIYDFVHGNMVIGDSKGDTWKYSELPGSMKPNLKKLDEFIGIDTTGKSY
jgi:hypothetical protein